MDTHQRLYQRQLLKTEMGVVGQVDENPQPEELKTFYKYAENLKICKLL